MSALTFLFTDVEGSTRLWEEHPIAAHAALARHDALIEQLVAEHRGALVRPRGEGDSRFAVFADAAHAVSAACAVQRAFVVEAWPTPNPLRVRIAVHTGSADFRDGDYYGSDVNRCARLRAVAHGGQTLLSESTAESARSALPAGATLHGLGQHRLKDLGEPERIYQLLHPDLPAEFPPLKSLSSLLNNLPLQVTSFVGRESELREVPRMLRATHLLTLLGAGGAGKTRLALHVAADLIDEFDDGVWFVELAPLTDAPLVAQALGSALGVREEPGRLLMDCVLDALRPKQALIVLDNCEHLIEACAQLAEMILRSCPHVRILATSREVFGVTGETAWRVPSLSLPEPGPRGSVAFEACLQSAAVRLFRDRAVAVQPGFTVTEHNAPAVVDVCRHLDGIPLAIELAAARVRALTPEQIANRLADRFHLLTRGSRAAPSRQQTLRALVDWSYDLLADLERAAFIRLAVFAGGWDLEAAEAVCAGDGIDGAAVLDLLSQLVDKSLVVAEPDAAGSTRYRLLETLRQYAADRLCETGGVDAIAARHAAHYLDFTQRAEPELTGPQQHDWIERLEREHDNLRAALAWSSTAGDPEPGLRLGGGLWRFWSMAGYLSEGREHLAQVLARPVESASDTARAARGAALHGAGTLASQQTDFVAARALLEESLNIRADMGDLRGMANSLNNLGIVARLQGELDDARVRFEESLNLQRQLGNAAGSANCLNNLGLVAQGQGDYAAARVFLEEGLAMSREMGDQSGVANRLTSLAEVALDAGEPAGVHVLLMESLAITLDLGDRRALAPVLEGLSALAAGSNDAPRALRLAGAGAALRQLVGAPRAPSEHERLERRLAGVRRSLSAERQSGLWAEGAAMDVDSAVAYALRLALADPEVVEQG